MGQAPARGGNSTGTVPHWRQAAGAAGSSKKLRVLILARATVARPLSRKSSSLSHGRHARASYRDDHGGPQDAAAGRIRVCSSWASETVSKGLRAVGRPPNLKGPSLRPGSGRSARLLFADYHSDTAPPPPRHTNTHAHKTRTHTLSLPHSLPPLPPTNFPPSPLQSLAHTNKQKHKHVRTTQHNNTHRSTPAAPQPASSCRKPPVHRADAIMMIM